ncbi:MAG: DUF4336 domain-containing protein [Myxococcota bacterium]
MTTLHPFAPRVWTANADHNMFGLALGARMTVVQQPGGSLWIHSPIALTPELRAEVDALGPVGIVVAPNAFHHVYVADWVRAFPEARLVGAAALVSKRKDLNFQGVLGQDLTFEGLRQQHIAGSLLDETVFLHEASGTLINCDLFENFQTCDHGLTRFYLKMGGVYGKPGLHPVIRLVYRDRAAARKGVAEVLNWDFDRVVISHGDCVTEDAQAVTRDGMRWLMGEG